MELQINDPEIVTQRELATHANDIKHLQDDMDKLVKDVEDIKTSIQDIQKTLSEAHGGWKFLMAAGGIASILGGIVTWFVSHWGGK